MKNVGLLTLPFHWNYGGILQGVALTRFIEDLGHQVTLLDRAAPASRLQRLARPFLQHVPGQNIMDARRLWLRASRHRRFIDKHIAHRTGPLRDGAAMTAAVAQHRLDAVVVGSDQIWRAKYGAPGSYRNRFLDFVPDGVRRISYAASFGDESWSVPDETAVFAGLLSRFSAVSVREKSGVAICAETLGRRDAMLALDPTLLVAPEFWQTIADPAKSDPAAPGKSVATYILDHSAETVRARDAILGSLGDYRRLQAAGVAGDMPAYSVPAWISSFRDADFVATDSFHGTVFAIIFRRNFVALANRARGAERFVTLLETLGLSDRLVFPDEGQDGAHLVHEPIDYGPVMARLEAERKKSADFLRAALA